MYRDSEITRRTALRNIGIAVGGIVGIAAVNKFSPSRVGAVEEGAAKVAQEMVKAGTWLGRTMYDESQSVEKTGYVNGTDQQYNP